MSAPWFRTARCVRAWLGGPAPSVDESLVLEREGQSVPAVLFRPRRARGPLPAWVILHGLTRRGAAHEQLVRFTRAVVSSGAVAIVPEVPEWRALRLAPGLSLPTLRAGVAGLRASGYARDEPVGVVGFSFGAPHAVTATAHPDLRNEVAGSVSFGGYCDLERTVRFLLTGVHEWRGHRYRLTPDPYGRWIVGANYLGAVPDYEGSSTVAAALRELATLAGDTGLPGHDPRLRDASARLRASLTEDHARLFDLIAPDPPDPHDRQGVTRRGELAEALTAAALRVEPELEPRAALSRVRHPVHVLHGRRDRLIPYSESLRMARALPPAARVRTTVTRLFGHAAQDSLPSLLRTAKEVPVFVAALRSVLRLV